MADPSVIVELGFDVDASVGTYLVLGDAARGKLGTGTLAPDLVWTDVSTYVRSFSVNRGSSRQVGPLVRYEAGTATVKLNNADRRFDPTYTAGPYTSGGVTQVTPMRAMRIRATFAGTTYELFRGFADAWRITYSMPRYSEVTLTATDAFKVLQTNNRAASAPVGANEDSGARITRILDSAGWPDDDRIIDTGSSTLQATDLSGSVLDELQSTADSEIGDVYIDGGGRVRFRSRHSVLTDDRSTTSQATFGAGASKMADLVTDYDDTQLINVVRATREGGAEQTATDADSVVAYFTHASQQSGLLLQTDAEALQWAGFVVYQSKDPELRFAALTLQPQRDPTTLYPQALGRDIGDRVTVTLQPPGGGSAIDRDVFIRAIAHQFDDRHEWTTTFGLQSATKYAFLVLDNTTLGQLDFNALSF